MSKTRHQFLDSSFSVPFRFSPTAFCRLPTTIYKPHFHNLFSFFLPQNLFFQSLTPSTFQLQLFSLMASTPTETVTDQSSPPSLEELARRSARAVLLPFIVGYASSSSSSSAPSERPREITIVVNPRTGSLTMIEGTIDAEAFLSGKDGRVPASKASIAAMPVMKVAEEGLACAICLADFEVGEEAKEMPCKHRYHKGCIDKWLGIQGSCPVCRYRMPVEEEEKNDKLGGGNNGSDGEAAESEMEDEGEEESGDGGGIGRIPTYVFHIYFAPRRRSSSNPGEATESNDDNSGSTEDVDGPSTHDMDVHSGSSSQEMDIDGSNP